VTDGGGKNKRLRGALPRGRALAVLARRAGPEAARDATVSVSEAKNERGHGRPRAVYEARIANDHDGLLLWCAALVIESLLNPLLIGVCRSPSTPT
jgi:hypothetical protein